MSAPDDTPPLDLDAIETRAPVARYATNVDQLALVAEVRRLRQIADGFERLSAAAAGRMDSAIAEEMRAREEARLWRALALAQRKAHRSGWPSDTVETQRARMALRSAGIDPDAEDPST